MNRLERWRAVLQFRLLLLRHPGRIRAEGRNYFLNGRVVFVDGGRLSLRSMNLFEERHHLEIQGGSLQIGANNYFNRDVKIACLKEIRIGDDCLFADSVYIVDHDHRFSEPGRPIRQQGYRLASVWIGNNVWVGARAIILKGVRIGHNAVIAAGSVVTRDIPDNCVAGGVPARVLKVRS